LYLNFTIDNMLKKILQKYKSYLKDTNFFDNFAQIKDDEFR